MTLRVRRTESGFAVLDALIAILITSFGLLALAGMQTRMNAAVMESFQRSQATMLLSNIVQRLETNGAEAAAYVTGVENPLGAAHCDAAELVTPTRAQLDLCEWANSLRGETEQVDVGQAEPNPVGGVTNGLGCIEQMVVRSDVDGACSPGVYRVTVVWQGYNLTAEPPTQCGTGLYGADGLRKGVSALVTVPVPNCI